MFSASEVVVAVVINVLVAAVRFFSYFIQKDLKTLFSSFSVWLDSVTRGQLHGLHEHRHLLDPEPGKSGRGDSPGRDATASGRTR